MQSLYSLHNAAPGSSLLTKSFNGSNNDKIVRDLELCYNKVRILKPQSSRSESSELFILAQNMKPIKQNA